MRKVINSKITHNKSTIIYCKICNDKIKVENSLRGIVKYCNYCKIEEYKRHNREWARRNSKKSIIYSNNKYLNQIIFKMLLEQYFK
jgi:hypothetical protein